MPSRCLLVAVLFASFLGSAQCESPAELAAHTFEGHTPISEQWDVVNKNTISAKHFKDPGVWMASSALNTWQDCQALCAANATCSSFAYADAKSMPKKHCSTAGVCFRADSSGSPQGSTPAISPQGARSLASRHRRPRRPRHPCHRRAAAGLPAEHCVHPDRRQDPRLGRDDYTDVSSLEAMPKLQKHLMQGGARMRNAFVNTHLLSIPHRVLLRPLLPQHRPAERPRLVHACGHNASGKKNTGLFRLLKQANYEVGVFGKVTNDAKPILTLLSSEESTSWINSPVDYNNFDGLGYWRDAANNWPTRRTCSSNPVYGTACQSTQIGNRTRNGSTCSTRAASAAARRRRRRCPAPAYLGPMHTLPGRATPDRHAMDDVVPITPNYNLSCPDKTQHIRQNPPLSDVAHCWQNQHFRDRWASLLSVDDILDAVVARLEAQGVLDKTFIFYSSDHGYKQGQWRVGTSKQHPYETDIRVPFLVRGPGVQANTTHDDIVGNVDLTPTLLSLAGG